jgi:hypothetical protein
MQNLLINSAATNKAVALFRIVCESENYMPTLTLNQETEIIALIDELNQYRNGNVTSAGILEVLNSTYISILKRNLHE